MPRPFKSVQPPGICGLALPATIPSRGGRPVAPKIPESAARRSGTRIDRALATWAPRASTCTINRRFASGWPDSCLYRLLLPVPRVPYVWHVARRLRSGVFLAAGLPAEPRGAAKRASPTADSARAAFRRRPIFATRRPVALAPLVHKHSMNTSKRRALKWQRTRR